MRFMPANLGGDNAKKKSSASKRRFGRLPQDTLVSNLGTVLDISAGGMRVLCRKVPRGRLEVKLLENELPGRLTGEVAWSRRVGLFKYEVGVRFDNMSPEIAQRLTAIAGANRLRRVM
jgi:hypothetical protein